MIGDQDGEYRRRAFQLARLRYALAQRNRAATPEAIRLADACILSLYKSCADEGDEVRALNLVKLFRRQVSPGA